MAVDMEYMTPKEIGEMMRKLRQGEKVECPECHKGSIVTPYDPAKTHYFECDNSECNFTINID